MLDLDLACQLRLTVPSGRGVALRRLVARPAPSGIASARGGCAAATSTTPTCTGWFSGRTCPWSLRRSRRCFGSGRRFCRGRGLSRTLRTVARATPATTTTSSRPRCVLFRGGFGRRCRRRRRRGRRIVILFDTWTRVTTLPLTPPFRTLLALRRCRSIGRRIALALLVPSASSRAGGPLRTTSLLARLAPFPVGAATSSAACSVVVPVAATAGHRPCPRHLRREVEQFDQLG